jgi:hypothetical protein
MTAATLTPVAALFKEWQHITTLCENRALSGEAVDRLGDVRAEMEQIMITTPSQTIEDVLMKVCAVTDFGEFSSVAEMRAGWEEARSLIGGAA